MLGRLGAFVPPKRWVFVMLSVSGCVLSNVPIQMNDVSLRRKAARQLKVK